MLASSSATHVPRPSQSHAANMKATRERNDDETNRSGLPTLPSLLTQPITPNYRLRNTAVHRQSSPLRNHGAMGHSNERRIHPVYSPDPRFRHPEAPRSPWSMTILHSFATTDREQHSVVTPHLLTCTRLRKWPVSSPAATCARCGYSSNPGELGALSGHKRHLPSPSPSSNLPTPHVPSTPQDHASLTRKGVVEIPSSRARP